VEELSFLTPLAGLVALVGLVPLAAFLGRERRAARVRETLGLAAPPPGPRRRLLAALAAVPALVGVAAAQPVVDRSTAVRERADAEVFFVLDTTRSMLAAQDPGGATRLDRARRAALEIRERLPGVPAGIASMTDRALPHLFPTVDRQSFRSTLARSICIACPAPQFSSSAIATNLSALAAFGRVSFFSPSVSRRLLVVLTDGETRAVEPGLTAALERARVRALFVHVWARKESIFLTSRPERQYRPDPTSARQLAQVAALVGGAVFAERDVDGAVARARRELGRGPNRPRRQRDLLALMPYATLVAAVPLAFVLRRRNL
jgi:hypothetical protein